MRAPAAISASAKRRSSVVPSGKSRWMASITSSAASDGRDPMARTILPRAPVRRRSSALAKLVVLLEVVEVGQPLVGRHLAGEDEALEELALDPARLLLGPAAQVFLLVADDGRQDGDVDVLARDGV